MTPRQKIRVGSILIGIGIYSVIKGCRPAHAIDAEEPPFNLKFAKKINIEEYLESKSRQQRSVPWSVKTSTYIVKVST